MQLSSGIRLWVVFVSAMTASANAATITFEKIADTATPVPSGTGNFSGFLEMAVDDGEVAFTANNQTGVYLYAGGSLVRIADLSTAVPGASGNFTSFYELSFRDGAVVFRGHRGGTPGLADGFQGVYTTLGGSLRRVADGSVPMPGGSSNFSGFQSPTIDSGRVVFVGGGAGMSAVFQESGGTLSLLVGPSTPVPAPAGTPPFFYGPAAAEGHVAFGGIDSYYRGLFIWDGLSVRLVADYHTPVPDGTGTFEHLDSPVFDGQTTAFHATPGSGIYAERQGALARVVDGTTMIPGGNDNFTGTAGTTLDRGNVAFRGFGSNPDRQGVYTDIGGALIKVIDTFDQLDGKTPQALTTHRFTLSGNQIVLHAVFTDGSRGLYLARIHDVCGNGVIEPGEHCDDGNMFDGDDCNPACRSGDPVPAASTWGLTAMALALLCAGTLAVERRATTTRAGLAGLD